MEEGRNEGAMSAWCLGLEISEYEYVSKGSSYRDRREIVGNRNNDTVLVTQVELCKENMFVDCATEYLCEFGFLPEKHPFQQTRL